MIEWRIRSTPRRRGPSAIGDGFNEQGIERGEGNRGTGRFPPIDRDFRPLRITHGVARYLDESESFVESSNNFIRLSGGGRVSYIIDRDRRGKRRN